MSGPVGIFYRQFSITLAISIVISGINALTLTPALCALMLKNTHGQPAKKNPLTRFFDGFNKGYDGLQNGYRKLLSSIVSRRMITIALLLGFCVATFGINSILPSGFIPTEDQGVINVNVTTPVGATVERTELVLDQIQKVAESLEPVESVSSLSGYSLLTESAGSSYGMAMINLKPWDQRKASVQDIIKEMEAKTKHITDAEIQFFPPPTVPGFGNSSGFELRVQDRSGNEDLQKTAEVTNKFIKDLAATPEIAAAFSNFDASFPQYMIHVDSDIAAKKGVSIDVAMSTLQTMIGSYYASNFIRFGQMYKVMVQADASFRKNPEDILKLYVKNNRGEMVPFSTFIKLERVYGPELLTRYNMYTSAMINGDAAPGYSSGDAIKAVERVAATSLPRGYSYDWSGMTREEILSGNQAIFIFAVCLIFVYLLLAAQYESFLLPLPVILSLPTGVFGAFLALKLMGLENNIYAQVSLVMLIGLLGKNAILIVEYAIIRQKEGRTVIEAVLEGATERLRPILMTSFAFVAGLIPLVMASGAGAIGNRSIGAAAAGGMLIGTIFGVIIIPGLYVVFASMARKKKTPPPLVAAEEEVLLH
jgi:HAE1 family hydrophobic/amphiphilic exporter-1